MATVETAPIPVRESSPRNDRYTFERFVVGSANRLAHAASQAVVLRTAVGSGFHALLRSAEATFEIDGVEGHARSGWSVIMSGVADEVTDPDEISRLDGLALDSWAPGRRGSTWQESVGMGGGGTKGGEEAGRGAQARRAGSVRHARPERVMLRPEYCSIGRMTAALRAQDR